MDEEQSMKIALFRYGLISPVIVGMLDENRSAADYYRETASKTHTLPDGKRIRFQPDTLKNWVRLYRRNGIHGLKPKQRIDLGKSRALTPEMEDAIHSEREKFPKITGQKIWEHLIENGVMRSSDVSVDTIQRYLRRHDEMNIPPDRKEKLPFEFEHVNDCWQTDTVNGPWLDTGGKKKSQTFLISILDDHSRHICKGKFHFHDSAASMLKTLKSAVRTCGIPKILVMDNGSAYNNAQLRAVCAEIGIGAVYLRPYAPQGKGKELYEAYFYPNFFWEPLSLRQSFEKKCG